MIAMKYTALVTVLAVIWTFYLSARVGAFRGKGGVAAPACTGTPEFERTFRTHCNTVDQMVLFVPVLWLAAAVIGAVWIVGRILYASEYKKDPTTRAPGMIMTVVPMGILALASLWGVIRQFL